MFFFSLRNNGDAHLQKIQQKREVRVCFALLVISFLFCFRFQLASQQKCIAPFVLNLHPFYVEYSTFHGGGDAHQSKKNNNTMHARFFFKPDRAKVSPNAQLATTTTISSQNTRFQKFQSSPSCNNRQQACFPTYTATVLHTKSINRFSSFVRLPKAYKSKKKQKNMKKHTEGKFYAAAHF